MRSTAFGWHEWLVKRSGSADAEASIAERRHLRVAQLERPVRIGDDHEVVAGALAFGERESLRHAPSLRPAADQPVAHR